MLVLACLNELQTEFSATGRPIPIRTFSNNGCRNNTCRQEGYVLVEPYWAPGTEVKVCAYDAQAFPRGTQNTQCDIFNGNGGCGCGPNLRECADKGTQGPSGILRHDLAEEPLRLFEHIIRQDRDYLEAFITQETLVNGPLVHYYKYFTHPDQTAPISRKLVAYDAKVDNLPDLGFTARDDWRVLERDEVHSGVLTTPAFLHRFASHRSRANRFYTAFRCEPFLPPEGGLPAETDPNPSPNLRERKGCSGCHNALEPAAAAWGRWRIGATYGFLSPQIFDSGAARQECQTCTSACGGYCGNYFFTSENAHPEELASWHGFPQVRAWLSEDEAQIIEQGPRALLDEPHEKERVAQCTVRNLAEHLLGRELNAHEITDWLPTLTTHFEENGRRFTSLVRQVVKSERYRTIR